MVPNANSWYNKKMVSSILSISLSGLEAASKRLSASASNIANLQTVGSLQQGEQQPYTPLTTTQSAQEGGTVRSEIVARSDPKFVPAFDPDSPFADENGVIGVPNINLAEEAVNSQIAETAYKASVSTLKVAQELSDELLSVFDDEA